MGRWDDPLLDRMRLVGDPPADEVVASILDSGEVDEVRALLRRVLHHDDVTDADLPEPLGDYLESIARVPDWADVERIARGQQVFERWGVAISVALFCASLPSAYACANGVHVLAQTARLETDTRRRIMETGQFLIDALGPGGLEPGGRGILAIQRVRLMHAAVRHLILARQHAEPASWDDAWGHPINQEDLAGTLMSFSYTVVEPLPRMGITISDDEMSDYLYVWEVIGHLLGVDDAMIPHSVAESTELVTLIRRRQYGRSDDGIEMTRALVGLLGEMTPVHALRSTIPDLIRMLSGDDVAEILDLPPRRRHFGLLALMKVWLRLTSHEVENQRILRRSSTTIGWHVLNGLFELERQGEHRADFDIPDHLASAWRLHVAP